MARQKDTEISPIPPEGAGGGASDDKPPPPHGTPRPMPIGDVPRVVNPLVRIEKGSGLMRFKISCRNYSPQPTKYIVAEDEGSARLHYLAVTKLDATVARLEKNKVANVEVPDLVVVALTD